MVQKVLRPWTVKPVLTDAAGGPVYLKIAESIIRDIRRGRLRPGAILPGSRDLATQLNVNRKTVILAFDELVSQGWVTSQGRRGTFVSLELPLSFRIAHTTLAQSVRKAPSEPSFALRQRPTPLLPDDVDATLPVLSDGVPDTRLTPYAALARMQNIAMRTLGHRNGLSYGDQLGSPQLRTSLACMLSSERGLNPTVDNICVTRGSQMAIYLAAQVLCRPGDTVVMEELSYPPAWEAFRHAGAEIATVPMDQDGLDPAALDQLCCIKHVVAIYVTPHHQFPTTRLMSERRRQQILALSEKHKFAIIEDDYDHEFHYQHKPILPLAAADDKGSVIYIGSLSKLLAPGLRCGYLVATRAFIREVEKIVLLIDRCGNPVVEMMLAEALSSGLIKRHAARTLSIYQTRLTHTCERLTYDFSEYFSFNKPVGGLALWATLTNGMDIDGLCAMAASKGLGITAGSTYSFNNTKHHALRLGYAEHTELEMDALLKILLRSCQELR